jgi:ABC-type multidrug transport system fused ATPase/permease subunit
MLGPFLENILDFFNIKNSITVLICLITAAFLMKGLFTFFTYSYIGKLRGKLLKKIKGELFDSFTKMNYQYYSSRDTGYFINVVDNQVGGTLSAFFNFTQLVSQILSTALYFLLAFFVAWRFGIMILIFGILLLFLFKKLNDYVTLISTASAKESTYLSKLLIQSIQAFKYLTATGQSHKLRNKIQESIFRLTQFQVKTDIASGFTQSVREPFAVLLIMMIILIQLLVFKGELSSILVSIMLFYRGFMSILGIQASWQLTLSNAGSIEIINDEFKVQSLVKEIDGNICLNKFSNSIQFEDVSFRYSQNAKNAINSLSINIPARTTVAIIGESGSGKSTLVDLITLILKPEEGKIFIDDIESRDIKLESWRKQIGYVSQEAVIFDETIAFNISLLDKEELDNPEIFENVINAAKQASLYDYILSLPEKFETRVGDRGLKLSGGQRQRLFIARELFKNPELLIFDEATSALDSESENEIQISIDNLKGEKTIILIAHRLSTVVKADKIFVIEKGRVVEEGRFSELASNMNSKLSNFVKLQRV